MATALLKLELCWHFWVPVAKRDVCSNHWVILGITIFFVVCFGLC